jgi:PAS domain S-box-containing protein
MSIKTKLIIALSILGLVIAGSSAAIWLGVREQNKLLENANARLIQFTAKSASMPTYIKDLHVEALQIQQFLTDVGATRNGTDAQTGIDAAKIHSQLFQKRLTGTRQLATELGLNDILVQLEPLESSFDNYFAVGIQMAEAYLRNDTSTANVLMRQFDDMAEDIGVRVDTMNWAAQLHFSETSAMIGEKIDHADDGAANLVYIVGGLSALSLLLVLSVAVMLHQNIMMPLSGIANVMKALAQGQTDITLPKINRGDEIGDVANALEVFKTSQVQKRSADFLRAMFNKVPVGILVCDERGQIKFANTYARTMLEMKAANPTDYSLSEFMPDITCKDDPEAELADALDKGPYVQSRRLDGRSFMSEVQVSRMDEEGRFLWALRDATRRIEAEKQRDALEVELRHAQKLESLGTMAGGVAHELNTPIQFVTDNMNFLRSAVDDQVSALGEYRSHVGADIASEIDERFDLSYVAEETPQAIAQSLEGLNRISEIVLAIKKFSYPSSAEKRENDFNDVVKTAATVSRNQWKYIADIEFDLQPDLPLVPSNAGELNQMMLNLIVNAAHAIEDKGESGKKGLIKITTRAVEGGIECTVKDSGVGIKPENKAKIFDLFFTTKAPGRGTGQGLSLVHSVVTRSHGGKIRVESEYQHGAAFIITLPITAVEEAESSAAA